MAVTKRYSLLKLLLPGGHVLWPPAGPQESTIPLVWPFPRMVYKSLRMLIGSPSSVVLYHTVSAIKHVSFTLNVLCIDIKYFP